MAGGGEETTATGARTVEVWVYGGVRVLRDGKRAHAWIDPAGELLLYSRIGAKAAVGYKYEVTVEREGEQVSLVGSPRFTPDQADMETRRRLAVEDSVANTRLATLARERKAANQDALDEALEPLVRLAKGMRTGAERDALIATVLRRLARTW